MRLARRWLFVVAALIWGIPGAIITSKGIGAYSEVSGEELWWHLVITAFVLLGFYFMFGRVVSRYTAHILSRPAIVSPTQTFPPKGWLLLLFMMSLGILLKYLPNIPQSFVASFYSGLGPMLLVSAVRFLRRFNG